MAKPTTAAMCRPLTDSRCVRPLRRIASASSWSTAFWSPVASATAMPAGPRGSRAADMLAQAVRGPGRARAARRLVDRDRAERLADRANAPEPGIAREIVGAGQRHRRRRRQPRAHRDPRARRDTGGNLVLVDRHPDARRQGRRRRARSAAAPCLARRDGRPLRPCRDTRPPAAGSAAAARPTAPAPTPARSRASRPARTSRAPARRARCPRTKPASASASADAQERQPLPRLVEREPGRDAAPEADDEPRRKLGALRLEQLLQLLVKRGNPRLPIAPSTLWKRRFPYVRGARPLHCSMKRRGKRA